MWSGILRKMFIPYGKDAGRLLRGALAVTRRLQDGIREEGDEGTLGVRRSRIMDVMSRVLDDLGETSWIRSMEWAGRSSTTAVSHSRPRDLAIVVMTTKE